MHPGPRLILDNDNFNKLSPLCTGTFGMPEENEFLANFTCRYLSFMDTDVAELVYYPTIDSAVQAVEDGKAWGVISMEKNFTRDLYQRIFESLVCWPGALLNLWLMKNDNINHI